MTPNLDSAPSTAGPATTQAVRLYSPLQVAFGTFGGPVGVTYFLWANFRALGRPGPARNTLVIGALGLLATVALALALPDASTNLFFTIAYIAIAKHVAEKYQMTKALIASTPGYAFQSNWRVLGAVLLCLAATFVIVFCVVLAL